MSKKRPENEAEVFGKYVGAHLWRAEMVPVRQEGGSLTTWRVPAYGFLEGFELTLSAPLPNMNTSSVGLLSAGLIYDGRPYHLETAFALCRDILDQPRSES